MSKKEQKEQGFDLSLPFKWMIVLIILFSLLNYLFHSIYPSFDFSKKKYSKQYLAKYYNVDKKTFNKWKVFLKNQYGILDDYPRRKLFDMIEVSFIIYKLGDPDELPVLSKGDIIEQCFGSYTSLRHSIYQFPDRFGISPETFKGMTKFPPSIAEKIKEQY